MKTSFVYFSVLGYLSALVTADLDAIETDDGFYLANDRLQTNITRNGGTIVELSLDGQDLLGPSSGSAGRGPYLDCNCVPSGFWTPGNDDPILELYSGEDSSGAKYGGFKMSDTYSDTGLVLEQYIFLREEETGLHMFSRVTYNDEDEPLLRNLGELRTLFRPNTDMWTHLIVNPDHYAPLPGDEGVDNQVEVQDATWDLSDTPDDPYVRQFSDYFTKYSFQTLYRDHEAAGMFADGTRTPYNEAFGAWMVMNTKDYYFGGPLFSDLTVDGIVYNYLVSGHHGNQNPNITDGFSRTFGPYYYYFNKGPQNTTFQDLYDDAVQYADPEWNADFYDSIAHLVPGYATTADRGTFELRIELPSSAKKPLAVLAENGTYFQDNVHDMEAYQYWGDIDADGHVSIQRVKEGVYRLTVYADGVFGWYVQDDVEVIAGETTEITASWEEENAGAEVFRIGYPDKSAGEFRHGYARDTSRPLEPEQYLIYWAAYDFPSDFPEGVVFRVGESDEAEDFNYIHWSVFGGKGNSVRQEMYVGQGDVNNWTVVFDVDEETHIRQRQQAIFTIQLAGVKTAAGNTDDFNSSEPHANLAYTVNINGQDLDPWIIPYWQSSSCGVRSSVVCYQNWHKFVFDVDLLRDGENDMVLSLPYNATNYEPALLTEALYVQYDALRLEVE